MGKGKISLTPQNRHLAGFMELEDEYLVIPPEIVVDGEKRKIGAIGSAAFASCRDLRTVVLLEGITKIGARAFERCGNLRDMEVPESLTEIGRNAFWGCESLEVIRIPESVVSIGSGVFCRCSSLRRGSIPSGIPAILFFRMQRAEERLSAVRSNRDRRRRISVVHAVVGGFTPGGSRKNWKRVILELYRPEDHLIAGWRN